MFYNSNHFLSLFRDLLPFGFNSIWTVKTGGDTRQNLVTVAFSFSQDKNNFFSHSQTYDIYATFLSFIFDSSQFSSIHWKSDNLLFRVMTSISFVSTTITSSGWIHLFHCSFVSQWPPSFFFSSIRRTVEHLSDYSQLYPYLNDDTKYNTNVLFTRTQIFYVLAINTTFQMNHTIIIYHHWYYRNINYRLPISFACHDFERFVHTVRLCNSTNNHKSLLYWCQAKYCFITWNVFVADFAVCVHTDMPCRN